MVKNPLELEDSELTTFGIVFCTNNYEIITTKPSNDNAPQSLEDFYKNNITYQKILDDENAYYDFFSMKYQNSQEKEVVIPLGVYGISDKNKLRFPLIIDSFWQPLLRLTKEEFGRVCNINNNQSLDSCFLRFLNARNLFIFNIFKYYSLLDPSYCSSMAWERRGKESSTRRIAESLFFHVYEREIHEMFSATEISSEMLSFIYSSYSRWGILGHTGLRDIERTYNPNKIELLMKIISQKHESTELS